MSDTISASLVMPPEKIRYTYSNISKDVARDLQSSGIFLRNDPERDKPREYDGQVPEDLDMLSNDELAHLMVIHQAWTSYLNGCYSTASASTKVADRTLKGVKSSIEQERGKNAVLSDPRYIKADAELLYCELKSDIIGDLLKMARTSYQLMSRLIALREQDMAQTTRRNVMQSSRIGRNR